MTINSSRLFQLFKYAVYALLTLNIVIFFREEYLATKVQFPSGVPLGDIIEAYATTIDTAAWVVLLLMFELETFVLDDHQFSPTVKWTLQGTRFFCYAFIIFAFYGYAVNLQVINQAIAHVGITDLCTLATDGWSYAIDLDEYTTITLDNCRSFTSATEFFRFNNVLATVDARGLNDIRNLATVDVINSGVWLLVVLVLEIDVRLQERNRFDGITLRISNVVKFILYGLLLIAAIYWGMKGDFVDFWDAFLWLVAFVFIELNVFEWRKEIKEAVKKGEIPATS